MHYLRPRDMHLVLVSSCLLGEAVRHNGGDKRCDHTVLQRWIHEGRVVAVCPEVSGGLPVPRPPAEIAGGVGGVKVLAGVAKVIDAHLRDVSAHFIRGAEQALARAKASSIRVAVLKEGSPSCGSSYIYDGTFTSTRIANPGVTAALLQQAGIRVFSESQLAEADALLQQLASESAA
jgi:uncharacterized protein YbbK (DUF523 family)